METVLKIAQLLKTERSRALLVGGGVRDELLGQSPKDFDLEVYGLAPGELISRLSNAGFALDLVGKAFGVIKIKGAAIDVSLPRRENKLGRGHQGFEIFSDPSLTPSEAALRRDFTINAIAKDPLTGELLDFHGGLEDLKNRVLRPTSEKFMEDPLRVLRAMQFIARFDLRPHPRLIEYSRRMDREGLPRERICEEFRKLLVRGVNIKSGLDFLKETAWLRFFPELAAMVGTPQDPVWHPEGDVFEHTGYCLNEHARQRGGQERDDLVAGLAVLLHDAAKPMTTQCVEGRWRAPGHEAKAREPAGRFLRSLTDEEDLIKAVIPLVVNHMMPTQLFRAGAGDAAVRRLALRVGRLDLLARVVICDKRGRPPLAAGEIPEVEWLLQTADRLAVTDRKPRPLVLGRHLLALGLAPGPQVGRILREIFEAQLDGQVGTLEEGMAMARRLTGLRPPSEGATSGG